MDYYVINTMPLEDDDLVFLATTPTGIELTEHRLSKGLPMGADYPSDVKMYMDDLHPGVELPDIVGNSRSLLLVSGRVKEVIARVHTAPAEYLPVTIYNHKKRKASSDYFIVNPLGAHDCLDLQKSDITWSEGKVATINEMVADPGKLREAPHLFRVKENPEVYVLSADLAQELANLEPTNVYIEELKTA